MISTFFSKNIIGVSTKSVHRNGLRKVMTVDEKSCDKLDEKNPSDIEIDRDELINGRVCLAVRCTDVDTLENVEEADEGGSQTGGEMGCSEGKTESIDPKDDVGDEERTVVGTLIIIESPATNGGEELKDSLECERGDENNLSVALSSSSSPHLRLDEMECNETDPTMVMTAVDTILDDVSISIGCVDNIHPLIQIPDENSDGKMDTCHEKVEIDFFNVEVVNGLGDAEDQKYEEDQEYDDFNEFVEDFLNRPVTMNQSAMDDLLLLNTSMEIAFLATDGDELKNQENNYIQITSNSLTVSILEPISEQLMTSLNTIEIKPNEIVKSDEVDQIVYTGLSDIRAQHSASTNSAESVFLFFKIPLPTPLQTLEKVPSFESASIFENQNSRVVTNVSEKSKPETVADVKGEEEVSVKMEAEEVPKIEEKAEEEPEVETEAEPEVEAGKKADFVLEVEAVDEPDIEAEDEPDIDVEVEAQANPDPEVEVEVEIEDTEDAGTVANTYVIDYKKMAAKLVDEIFGNIYAQILARDVIETIIQNINRRSDAEVLVRAIIEKVEQKLSTTESVVVVVVVPNNADSRASDCREVNIASDLEYTDSEVTDSVKIDSVNIDSVKINSLKMDSLFESDDVISSSDKGGKSEFDEVMAPLSPPSVTDLHSRSSPYHKEHSPLGEHSLQEEPSLQEDYSGEEQSHLCKEYSSPCILDAIPTEELHRVVKNALSIIPDIDPRTTVDNCVACADECTEIEDNPYRWLQRDISSKDYNFQKMIIDNEISGRPLVTENNGNNFGVLKYGNDSLSSKYENDRIIYYLNGKMVSCRDIELLEKSGKGFDLSCRDEAENRVEFEVDAVITCDDDQGPKRENQNIDDNNENQNIEDNNNYYCDNDNSNNNNNDNNNKSNNNNDDKNNNNNDNDVNDNDDNDITTKSFLIIEESSICLQKIERNIPSSSHSPTDLIFPITQYQKSDFSDKLVVEKEEMNPIEENDVTDLNANLLLVLNKNQHENVHENVLKNDVKLKIVNLKSNDEVSGNFNLNYSLPHNIFYDCDINMLEFDKIVFNSRDGNPLDDEDTHNYLNNIIRSDSKSNDDDDDSSNNDDNDDDNNDKNKNDDLMKVESDKLDTGYSINRILSKCKSLSSSSSSSSSEEKVVTYINIHDDNDDNTKIGFTENEFNDYDNYDNKNKRFNDNFFDENNDDKIEIMTINTYKETVIPLINESIPAKEDLLYTNTNNDKKNDTFSRFLSPVALIRILQTQSRPLNKNITDSPYLSLNDKRKIPINYNQNQNQNSHRRKRNKIHEIKSIKIKNEKIVIDNNDDDNDMNDHDDIDNNYDNKIRYKSNNNNNNDNNTNIMSKSLNNLLYQNKSGILTSTFSSSSSHLSFSQTQLPIMKNSDIYSLNSIQPKKSKILTNKHSPYLVSDKFFNSSRNIIPIYDQLLPKTVISKSFQSTIMLLDSERERNEKNLIISNEIELFDHSINHVGKFQPRYSMYAVPNSNSELIKNRLRISEIRSRGGNRCNTSNNSNNNDNNNNYNNNSSNDHNYLNNDDDDNRSSNNNNNNRNNDNNNRNNDNNNRNNDNNNNNNNRNDDDNNNNNNNNNNRNNNSAIIDEDSIMIDSIYKSLKTREENRKNTKVNLVEKKVSSEKYSSKSQKDFIHNFDNNVDDKNNNNIKKTDNDISIDKSNINDIYHDLDIDNNLKNNGIHSISEFSVLCKHGSHRHGPILAEKIKLIDLKKNHLREKSLEKINFIANWKTKFIKFLDSNFYSSISLLIKAIESLREQYTVLNSAVRSADILVNELKLKSKKLNSIKMNPYDVMNKNKNHDYDNKNYNINQMKSLEQNSISHHNTFNTTTASKEQEKKNVFDSFTALEFFCILVDRKGSIKNSIKKLKNKEYRSEIHFVCNNEFINIKEFLFMIIGAEELFEENFK